MDVRIWVRDPYVFTNDAQHAFERALRSVVSSSETCMYRAAKGGIDTCLLEGVSRRSAQDAIVAIRAFHQQAIFLEQIQRGRLAHSYNSFCIYEQNLSTKRNAYNNQPDPPPSWEEIAEFVDQGGWYD